VRRPGGEAADQSDGSAVDRDEIPLGHEDMHMSDPARLDEWHDESGPVTEVLGPHGFAFPAQPGQAFGLQPQMVGDRPFPGRGLLGQLDIHEEELGCREPLTCLSHVGPSDDPLRHRHH
jgi:hypothetical protein